MKIMNINIVKNKYVNAVLLLMLFSAGAHMAIRLYVAIRQWDFYFINYFNILDVTYFLPNFLHSVLGNVFATLFTIIIYVIILKLNDDNRQ